MCPAPIRSHTLTLPVQAEHQGGHTGPAGWHAHACAPMRVGWCLYEAARVLRGGVCTYQGAYSSACVRGLFTRARAGAYRPCRVVRRGRSGCGSRAHPHPLPLLPHHMCPLPPVPHHPRSPCVRYVNREGYTSPSSCPLVRNEGGGMQGGGGDVAHTHRANSAQRGQQRREGGANGRTRVRTPPPPQRVAMPFPGLLASATHEGGRGNGKPGPSHF
jgi:hypothetical protein